MAKAFKITDSNGNDWEGNKTAWGEARSIAFQTTMDSGIEYKFFLYGEEVDLNGFNEAIDLIENEKYNKKLETHKEIYIPDGVAIAATKKYRKVWVRR